MGDPGSPHPIHLVRCIESSVPHVVSSSQEGSLECRDKAARELRPWNRVANRMLIGAIPRRSIGPFPHPRLPSGTNIFEGFCAFHSLCPMHLARSSPSNPAPRQAVSLFLSPGSARLASCGLQNFRSEDVYSRGKEGYFHPGGKATCEVQANC